MRNIFAFLKLGTFFIKNLRLTTRHQNALSAIQNIAKLDKAVYSLMSA